MLVIAARSTLVDELEVVDVRVHDHEYAHAGAANGAANGSDYDARRVEYDVASALISYEEYHPFGTSAYRAVDSTIEVSAKRYRYAAAERDEETGLDHMGLRYYAPWLGRWTSADPIGLGDGVNRYAYVHGNPVSMRDPGGTFAEHTVKSPERPTAAPEGAGEGRWVEVGGYTKVRENGPGESGSIWEWRSSEGEDPVAARERALGLRPGSLREQAAFERREMQRMRTEAAAQRAEAREAIANQETAEAAGRIFRTTAPVVGAAEAGARILAPGVTTAVDVIDALLSDDPEDRAQAALGLAQSALEKRFPFLRMRRLGEGKQSEALPESTQKALPEGQQKALPPARETPALGPASDAGSGGQNATRTGVRRTNPADWRALRDLWDEMGIGDILSEVNRRNIAKGRTPVVDEAWIRHFPGDASLMGEKIPMHHIKGSRITVPLPASRHLDAHMPGGFRWNPGGPGRTG